MPKGVPGPASPSDPERPDGREEIFEDSLPADLLPLHEDYQTEPRSWTREHREQREDVLRELLVRRLVTAFFCGLAGLFALIVLKVLLRSPVDVVTPWGSAVLTLSTVLTIAIRYYYRKRK